MYDQFSPVIVPAAIPVELPAMNWIFARKESISESSIDDDDTRGIHVVGEAEVPSSEYGGPERREEIRRDRGSICYRKVLVLLVFRAFDRNSLTIAARRRKHIGECD